MKIWFWTLLLMGLFVPGRGDCQGDCLSCSHILPKEQDFDTLVCLVECRNMVARLTWERCRNALEGEPLTALSMLKRAEEEVETVLPMGQSDGTLQRFHHLSQAVDLDRLNQENQISRFRSPLDAEELISDQDTEPLNLSKRFGGFLKSKYGYRKFMDPGRSVQKRYGGFIGVRKSARKWNNQKRFSEILKQYLGISARASAFNSVSTDITQQNEV